MKEDGLDWLGYDAMRKAAESETFQKILHQIGMKGHEIYSAAGTYSSYLGEAFEKAIDHPMQSALYLGFVVVGAAVFKGNIRESRAYTNKNLENDDQKRRAKLAADVNAMRSYNYKEDSQETSADTQFFLSQRRNIDRNGLIYQRPANR